MLMDILDRKTAEEILQESELRFRALANVVPTIVWTAAPDGTITFANDQWFRFCGITSEQNAQGWPELVLHPDDQTRCLEAWTEALRSGHDYEIEVRNRRFDGAYRWFLTRAVPVRDHQGTITAWFGTTTDIHDRKLTEDALRTSEARFRTIVETANEGIWLIGIDACTQFVNARMAAMLGCTPDEMIGRSVLEFTFPEDEPNHRERIGRNLAGEFEQFETRFRRRDGTAIPVLAATSAVRDECRQASGALGMFCDMSEKKALEEQQALLMRELHHRVKNTLTTVQAVVNSTARNATSVHHFKDAVTQRITSLAKTHTLLFDNEMAGVQLREILRSELEPYDDQSGSRILLDGPDLYLPPDLALAFGMAAHELTTNAAKYGALSHPRGCVHASWRFCNRDGTETRIRFEWTEQGGPPVAEPDHKGFGTLLLDRVLGRQLGGEVEVAFAPEGLRVQVEAILPGLAWD
ncbi:PAS domain S-box protein [Microvirga sp. HBU67558]|uniref:PAS domain S-box protein n=1 Tax=Microvirga TaxID=186650 RepID=UPI001B3588AE|nr:MULTISPECIES: PAS domain S-box protein [unclassified Microvirga]MBQ0822856.1 PAS domain S-box protein [Microvirga sp. HBU67558]